MYRLHIESELERVKDRVVEEYDTTIEAPRHLPWGACRVVWGVHQVTSTLQLCTVHQIVHTGRWETIPACTTACFGSTGCLLLTIGA